MINTLINKLKVLSWIKKRLQELGGVVAEATEQEKALEAAATTKEKILEEGSKDNEEVLKENI